MVSAKPPVCNPPPNLSGATYAVLRYEGASPPRACAVLALGPRAGARLERWFLAHRGGGEDQMRPRFAQHAAHVAAVIAEGGYPVLPDACAPMRRRRS